MDDKDKSVKDAASQKSGRRYISWGTMSVMIVVAVASLRSDPADAFYGLGSIFYYIIPALVFLIPTALVAAELASGWKGGIYIWVREGMGNRWGFTAIWLQWIQNVVWYPSQLAFVAAALAYVFMAPNLANSGYYTATVILVAYWASTLIALRGNNIFARVGAWGGIIGTFIPGAVLILLGGLWLGTHQPSQVPISWSNVIPPFTGLASVVLIVSNFLAYAGMEVNAVHVDQLKNPSKDYTKALLVAFGIILAVFIPPTLAVAIAVPPAKLGLTSGITAAFEVFFEHWGVNWLTPILSLMVVLGALASVVVWIAGPSKGLLIAGRTGLLPPFLQKRNKAGIQQGILIPQGIIVTILAALFVFIPNVSVAFFLLIAAAAQLYLLMYILMFISAMTLRVKKPDVKRTYRVPAMNFIAIVGLVASALAFALGFIPPSELKGVPLVAYPLIVLAITFGLFIIPIIIYAVRKPEWKTVSDEEFAELIGAHATP
ncbi:MAG: amino acid permease, partial [Candidatus Parvarchaeota archaeon]|nr:amino acid permease [Candidatus Jingweiarchaeum tengchongense]